MKLDLLFFFFQMDVFDVAERYARDNTPLILICGKDYGSGSSRDWAAKGPFLLVSFLKFFVLIFFWR